MKTKSFAPDDSRRFSQCALLALAIVVTSTLVSVHQVFAQANVGSDPDNPLPWGSVNVANPPGPFGAPENYSVSSNSLPIAPAPMQPLQPESPQVSVPPPPDANADDADNPLPWGTTVVNNQDNYGDLLMARRLLDNVKHLAFSA